MDPREKCCWQGKNFANALKSNDHTTTVYRSFCTCYMESDRRKGRSVLDVFSSVSGSFSGSCSCFFCTEELRNGNGKFTIDLFCSLELFL